LPPATARKLAKILNARASRHPDGEEQLQTWSELRAVLLEDPKSRWNFEAHKLVYDLAYADRDSKAGPALAWAPSPDMVRESNLGKLMAERRVRTFEDLHRWSVEHREEFWSTMVAKLGIRFRKPPRLALDPHSAATHPEWLPGAEMNIAESCFSADPAKVAIVAASEVHEAARRTTYGELQRLAARVANGIEGMELPPRARIAIYMPMTPESVAIYLGVVLSGRCVVGIADATAPPDFDKRVRIAGAKAVFTMDSTVRDGKAHGIYEKVVAARGPRAVVVPADPEVPPAIERDRDARWEEFLGDKDAYRAVRCRPSDYTNILFSSGTTKDPKAIPWTHTTPIKCAADAYLHQDVRPSDVLAWPTSFGWMMGPWLTYASLMNGATMALYVGGAGRRAFGEFVSQAGVTMLGVVPKLVRAWKAGRTMEGLDWSRIRVFSSTAEPSTPEEMLYLMFLAGYAPVVEYCGGTEIGGGYITGTVVQPCAPATFTTPAMGLDFVVLDEGRPADRGEVFLVPPSIGLSNELLNYDHDREYYAGLPLGPHGERLRRHGDRIERLAAGYYRHRGRIDDMINIHGVKTSAEEIRSVIGNDLVYDSKPIAVDTDGTGQHRLVIYAVPRDPNRVESAELREKLRGEFQRAIKENLNPLLGHVEDVVLVAELPQAGPGKTRTMADLRRDYLARIGRG